MKVKICGITNKEDALLAESLGADALGFIFYKESKRYISPDSAGEIIKSLSPLILKAGVFVNEDPEVINKISSQIKLNVVQLHGNENPNAAEAIDLPVIKSFRINGKMDYNQITQYKNVAYLFDSFSEKELGGTGIKFNWDSIPKELKGNFILAGGISSENIEEIFKDIKPLGVDVSSSVEISPGIKDHNKLKYFFYNLNRLRSI